MTVKELLNKYDFYDYDKTGFESFAVFFPKDDFEKAKSFDIDYIDSIENHKELIEKQLDLEVLYYKIIVLTNLKKQFSSTKLGLTMTKLHLLFQNGFVY